MAAMRLKEIAQQTSVDESRAVMDFLPGPTAPDTDVPKALPWTAIKAWVKSLFPASLKNPQPLKFTGAVTDSYDGSAAKTVNVPTEAKNHKPLKITYAPGGSNPTPGDAVEYDGSAEKEVRIYMPNANRGALTIIDPNQGHWPDGGMAYDGSEEVMYIASTTLPNPFPLRLTGIAKGEYTGISSVTVNIPETVRIPQPTGMALDYPALVSVRNAVLQRISARLVPALVMQDCVLFLPAGGYGIALQPDGTFRALPDVIDLYPDGTFRAKSVGTSRVYAIPTMAPGAYRVAEITVRPALLRRTGGGGIRRMSGGMPRIC